MKKRIISSLLCLVMVISILPQVTLTAQASYTDGIYTYTVSNGEAIITDCDSSASGAITIPETLGGYPVTKLGFQAFYECTRLTSITIPDSVTSIGSYAFTSCNSLVNVNIPLGVATIGDYLFGNCKSLTSITLPSSVTTVGDFAFYECDGLTSIIFPTSIKTIGEYVFEGCDNLTVLYYTGTEQEWETIDNKSADVFLDNDPLFGRITVQYNYKEQNLVANGTCGDNLIWSLYDDGTLTISGTGAMWDWSSYSSVPWYSSRSSIDSVVIPDSVTTIGNYAFYDCDSLTSVEIGDSVTTIGDYAFRSCNVLKNLIIGDGVTTIGDETFRYCTSLTSVIIPDSVITLGRAFEDCTSLTNVEIGNSVTTIGENAFYRSRLTSIKIPDSVTYIGERAFSACENLRSVIIGNSVKTIDDFAFAHCSWLSSVYMGTGINSIGYCSFYDCNSLSDIYYTGSKYNWDNMYIYGDNDDLINATIHYNYYTPIDYEYLPRINISNGTFNFASGKGEGRFDYDDFYFNGSSYTYNHVLAKTSMRLALSAFGKIEKIKNDKGEVVCKNYNNAPQNALELLGEMGFLAVTPSDSYTVAPTRNSIGVITGRKHVVYPDGNYTLIAVAIRGGGYENEWGGNFNVGDGDLHAGFELARDQVVEFVSQYIRDERIGGKIKLWITGYSRAAATANLTAAYFDENPTSAGIYVTLEPEDIYAYCFEPPMGVKNPDNESGLYDNIFSIVNQHDFVPMVAMREWGFDRYGITKYLPAPQTNGDYYGLKQNMLDYFEQYCADEYYIDDFTYYYTFASKDKLTKNGLGVQGVYLENVMDKLAKNVGDTANYERELQDVFEYIGEYVVGLGKTDELTTNLLEEMEDRALLYVVDGTYLTNPYVSWVGLGTAYLTTRSAIRAAFDNMNIDLSRNAVDTIARLIIDIGLDKAVTLLKNTSGIAQAHFPELCMAWLDAIDEDDFADKRLRSIYLNCPVNLEVYDSGDKLVAAIYNDVPQEIDGSSIIAYIDENGQKVVHLPQDEEFRIEVIATDDGEVTYSVQEQSADGSATKVINYNNMTVKKNDTLTGVAENLSTVEVADYALSSDTVEVSEAEIIEEAEPVSVELYIEGNGITSSGGEHYKGEFAQVTATPSENEEFLGWYDGDTLVSTEAVYRFQVMESIALTARFSENTCEIAFFDAENYIINTVRIVKGSSVIFPKAPATSWGKFDRYVTENGDEVNEDTVFYEDAAVYAQYIEPDYLNDYLVYWLEGNNIELAGFRYNPSGDEVLVPISIDGYNVVAISDYALSNIEYAGTLVIPDSITKIGEYAFDNSNIGRICYLGSKADWEAIDIAENNEALDDIDITFEYSDNIVVGYLENVQYSGYAVTGVIYFDYVYKDCTAVIEVFNEKGKLETTSYVNVPKGAYKKYIGLPMTADDRKHSIKISFVNNSDEMEQYGTCNCDYGTFYAEKVRLYEGEFAYTLINGKAEILGYDGTDAEIDIPETLAGFTVTGIGDFAFAGRNDITSVIIPDSITYIGECAFAETAIKTITIPASVSEIGDLAFDCCDELEDIIVDADSKYFVNVDGHLYTKDMTKLLRYDISKQDSEFVIPNTVTIIGGGAFSEAALTSITIPDSVKVIEKHAFSMSSITSVNIPASVETIEEYAFAYCYALESINVDEENSKYSSADGVLFDKTKTTLILYPCAKEDTFYQIPNGVEVLGTEAICNAYLQKLAIPKSLKLVSERAIPQTEMLDTILYAGNEDEYLDIDITYGNDALRYSNITYGYNGLAASIRSVKCRYNDNKVIADVSFNYLLEDATLILAVYDENGKYVTTRNCPVTLGESSTYIELDADERYKDYNVKVMLWKDSGSMNPLANSVQTEITEAFVVDAVLESYHPYDNYMDESNVYSYDGECNSIDVTFTEDTQTENGYDYIYIYDLNGNEIGRYCGTALAGDTVNIPGNGFRIRLTSDGSYTQYGYRTESIVVNK